MSTVVRPFHLTGKYPGQIIASYRYPFNCDVDYNDYILFDKQWLSCLIFDSGKIFWCLRAANICCDHRHIFIKLMAA